MDSSFKKTNKEQFHGKKYHRLHYQHLRVLRYG